MIANISPPPGSGAQKQTMSFETENGEFVAILVTNDFCCAWENIPKTNKEKIDMVNSVIAIIWKSPTSHKKYCLK